MTERLLQYIWQFQHYNRSELQIEQGENLQIICAGMLNVNQGPDFLGGKVKIGDTLWVGNVELHLRTSDWFRHLHQNDENYKNIILHVVWKNDAPPGSRFLPGIPLLELQTRVPALLLQRYEDWMNNPSFVPCEKHITAVKELVWQKWKERLVIERLQRKSVFIIDRYEQSNRHWEETFWWIIARNFGIRVNADAFEEMARSIPVKVLTKHKYQANQLEAILFGQAGLLDRRFKGTYPRMLQKEYRYLRQMHRFPKIFVSLKFMRMRPSAFPSIRLAQLASLIGQSTHLFSKVKESVSLGEVKALLHVTANDYWHYYYRFDEPTALCKKNLGDDMVNNILLNTIIPVLFAYGSLNSEQVYIDRVLGWMEEIESEKNRITKGWVTCGVANRHAFDSQSLLELKTQYCDYKRCLECSVGNALLGRG